MALMLFVVVAASLHARVVDVRLLSADTRSAVQVTMTRPPGRVVIRRDGDLTRVSLERTGLGPGFSGGDHFQWSPEPGSTGSRRAHCPEALWIERGRGEVIVSLRLPPDVSVEPRPQGSTVFFVFREGRPDPVAATRAEARAASPPAAPVPTREPLPTASAAAVAAPAPSLPDPDATQDLVRQLLSTLASPSAEATAVTSGDGAGGGDTATRTVSLATREPTEPAPSDSSHRVAQLLSSLSAAADAPAGTHGNTTTEGVDAATLYLRLFPRGAPTPAPTAEPPTGGEHALPERTLRLGFLTLKPALRVAYMDATASLLGDTGTVRDRYLEIRPDVEIGTTLLRGRLRAQYEPAVRWFGGFEPTRSTSHRAAASLDIGAEGPFRLRVRDAWAAGVLEAQEVDPGGEYFFDLHRFWRNAAGVTASHEVAPRWRLEAAGGLSQVRFRAPGPFFDHDTWTLDLGLDHEITENLRVSLAYDHGRVPRRAERPQAESTAHGVRGSITGQATPFVNAQVMVGYREQEHPFAGEGGREYRGLVLQGTVTRRLGRVSRVTLIGGRTALLSAFEDNGFYVSSQVEASAAFRLPHGLLLDGALGYRWNDYRTVAREIGSPRGDAIFDWTVGVRRPLGSGRVGVGYQRQRRRSNIDRFDTTTDRLMLQIDFDVFRGAGFR